MRPSRTSIALAAGLVVGTCALARPATSQTADSPHDSTHHFALFGGVSAALQGNGPAAVGGRGIGVSGDFRWAPIPVPLRLSLSFDQRDMPYAYQPLRGGRASLDMVFHPIPKTFGIRPYLLGGFGVGTNAPYSFIAGGCYAAPGLPCQPYTTVSRPRETWAFASGGAGLDIGRLFMQLKVEHPVASQGPIVVPFTVGFRFWD